MFTLGEIAFGDNVSIVDADVTRRSGHARLLGVCYGITTPSVAAVEVIGEASEDVALNVHFDEEAIDDAWFAPDLVLLVDRAAGSVATVGDQSFTKTADGDWVPVDDAKEPARRSRRWFRRRE